VPVENKAQRAVSWSKTRGLVESGCEKKKGILFRSSEFPTQISVRKRSWRCPYFDHHL